MLLIWKQELWRTYGMKILVKPKKYFWTNNLYFYWFLSLDKSLFFYMRIIAAKVNIARSDRICNCPTPLKSMEPVLDCGPRLQPLQDQQFSFIVYFTEVNSLNGTVGRRPQVKLRSRAPVPGRHWSGCTPRPIEFEHRALDLRLTWGFLPQSPFKTSLRGEFRGENAARRSKVWRFIFLPAHFLSSICCELPLQGEREAGSSMNVITFF